MVETISYVVPDMSCRHCEVAVTEELQAVVGVRAVAVDLDRKLVAVHGEGLEDAVLRAAIVEAGYEAV